MGNVRDGTRDSNNKTSAIPVTLQELHWIFSSDHLPLYSDIPAIHFYSYHYHCSFSFSNTFTFIFHWPLKRLQKILVTILHLFTTALKGNDSTMFSEESSARAKKIYPFLWSAKWIHNPLLVLLLMGVLLCPPHDTCARAFRHVHVKWSLSRQEYPHNATQRAAGFYHTCIFT